MIQSLFGWDSSHLYMFKNGIETIAYDDGDVYSDEVELKERLYKRKQSIDYIYDFGDDWHHIIKVEDILEIENRTYPECIDAKKANAFDDIGGIWGYQNFLEVMKDKNHPDYENMRGWCDCDSYDEDRVSVDEINSIIHEKD